MILEHPPLTASPMSTMTRSNVRVYERLACDRPTLCRPVSHLSIKERGWASLICDISKSGVRLHLQRRFEKGTPLAIELPASQERDVSVVFVKVVHTKAHGDGSWIMGCQFVSELSDEELQRVVETPPPIANFKKEPPAPAVEREVDGIDASVDDANGAPAEAQFLTNVHFRIEVLGGSRIRCVVKRINLSRSGPMTPGKAIRIRGAGDDGKWALDLAVTQCVRELDCWKVEARLLQKPNLSKLLRALGHST